jgi:protein TonB
MQVSKMERQMQDLPRIDIPDIDVPMVAGTGVFIGNFKPSDQAAEGEIIPVMVIRPMYPREAALSGTEGWVKVEFTITETGTVKDPHVIESDPPRVFNREAIRAILKWKFKPRVVNGIAVERRATQVIDFSLDKS